MVAQNISQNYKNAFSEVYEILEHLNKDDYEKISKEFLEAIKTNRNEDYVFSLKTNVELKDQDLMPETRAILFNLFYDYYADEKQKQIIQDIWNTQKRKEDIEKQAKYDVDVFKSEKEKTENYEVSHSLENNGSTEMIISNKENFFTRIINKIKRILRW